jgi:hypothetical protein
LRTRRRGMCLEDSAFAKLFRPCDIHPNRYSRLNHQFTTRRLETGRRTIAALRPFVFGKKDNLAIVHIEFCECFHTGRSSNAVKTGNKRGICRK